MFIWHYHVLLSAVCYLAALCQQLKTYADHIVNISVRCLVLTAVPLRVWVFLYILQLSIRSEILVLNNEVKGEIQEARILVLLINQLNAQNLVL